jgi:hypothetical protein
VGVARCKGQDAGLQSSVGELKGRKSLGKLGIRWKDDIKVDHKIEGVN